MATSDVEINIHRVTLRALDGGHSAPPDRLREIHARSLANLPSAIATFNLVHIYDGSGPRPVFIAELRDRVCTGIETAPPEWLRRALGETPAVGRRLGARRRRRR